MGLQGKGPELQGVYDPTSQLTLVVAGLLTAVFEVHAPCPIAAPAPGR
jgi:hypothetical protein